MRLRADASPASQAHPHETDAEYDARSDAHTAYVKAHHAFHADQDEKRMSSDPHGRWPGDPVPESLHQQDVRTRALENSIERVRLFIMTLEDELS